MLEYLQSVLRTKCELDPRLPVLVGVSGGPDSLCLLDGLHRLGYDLIVAHLDHRLRPESLEEARAVERMAGDRDLPFILEYENVNQYAIQQGNSVEEAARILRYRFLFRVAAAQNFQAVVVGHTADDQVETVLMHILRGAGLDGLKGMTYRSLPNAWSDTIPLVRPLLGAWRDEIMAYINAKDLHPLEDASNLDMRFYRNRLRNELIPYLEGLNPGVRGRLWRMADILAEDHNVLEKITEDIWNACLQESGAGYLAIGLQILADQPLGVRRRLVRRAISMLRPGLPRYRLCRREPRPEFYLRPFHERAGRFDRRASHGGRRTASVVGSLGGRLAGP